MVNTIPVRFMLFVLSSIALGDGGARAVMITMGRLRGNDPNNMMTGAGILRRWWLARLTMAMWLWMYATRIPVMNKMRLHDRDQGGTGATSTGCCRQVQWIAHNCSNPHSADGVLRVALGAGFAGQGGAQHEATRLGVGLRVLHSAGFGDQQPGHGPLARAVQSVYC